MPLNRFRLSMLVFLVISAHLAPAQEQNLEEMINAALGKVPSALASVPAEIKRVAIYTIEPDPAGKINIPSLQDRLVTILLESGRFQVIDRQSLEALMKEQQLSMSGVVQTTEMVKTGKLIGVQGFFFGSVDLQKGKMILNLKLIDVESSATVFSKKFEGEVIAGLSRLGLAIGYAGSPSYGADFWLYKEAIPPVSRTTLDTLALSGLNSTSIMNFAVSYRQGFKGLDWAQFGFDIGYVDFYSTKEGEHKSGDTKVAFGQDTLNFGDVYELSYWQLFLVPKFYLSGKKLFKLKQDWVNPFLGARIVLHSFNVYWGTWHNHSYYDVSGNWTGVTDVHDYEERDESTDPLVTLAPVLGLEINFTRSLSLHAEGSYILKRAEVQEVLGAWLAELNLESSHFVEPSFSFDIGLRYYFTLF